ncbi:AAA family ATPase [Pseudomonas viridiflava]|uniref:AAA family ATPase n=1 Tax=Pseudomonas viridiflava TaxID=33069 RepID=UPI002ECD7047|nr:AAA family ATPase [Pseudomonas viridiflava]
MFRLIKVKPGTGQQFVAPSHNPKEPFKSVIVGGNATGKTRFMVSIIEAFRGLAATKALSNDMVSRSYKKRTPFTPGFSFSYYMDGEKVDCKYDTKGLHVDVDGEPINHKEIPLPSRVIAISASWNDKFPFSDTDEDNFYKYCGVRETSNASWTATLSRRSIENLLNVPLRLHQESITELFEYLGIDTKLKITFRFRNAEDLLALIGDPHELVSFVQSYSKNNSRMQVDFFKKFSLQDALRVEAGWNRISRKKTFELDVNLRHTTVDYSDAYFAINVFRRIGLITDVDLRVQKIDSTEAYPFASSSSGEAQLLYCFSSIIRHAKDNCLIIIDEPEISLHPAWQIKYISLLKRALSSFRGCHVLIATHSHFIVSDLASESSSLHIFKKIEGISDIRNVEYSTYAWSADNILYDVFDVRNVGNLAFERDLELALKLIVQKTTNFTELRALKQKFEKVLFQDSDPLKKVIDTISEYVDGNH